MNSNTPAVAGNHVLNDVLTFIRRFVSLSEVQAIVIALWIAHTHAFDASYATPYLSVTSAEKQCGKTRLLEVLRLLVANPWLTGSVSKAALVRKLDAQRPTLLLDESDAAFARDKDYSEALRAVLNSGHSREADVVSLCVGQAASMEVRDFHVFCPKAIAGIGKLPDTVADRSIPIRLKRRAPGEQIERFRRHLKPQADGIRGQIGAWAVGTISRLKNAKPTLPDSLSDRQQDGCEPLLAIADAAGGEWPEKARNALIEILTGEVAEDNSIGVRLLTDIRQIFDNQQVASLPTSELVSILCDDNPFWLEFSHGKPISATGLARLLKPYGISHRKLRVGEATPWGYQRSAFEDPWARYLPRNLEQVEQNSNGAGEMQLQELEHIPPVPALQGEESTIRMRLVPDVPLPTNHQGRPRQCSTHGFHVVWWERSLGGGDWVCGRCHPSPGVDSDLGHVLTATEIGFGTS